MVRNFFIEHGEWYLESATTQYLEISKRYPIFNVRLTLRRRPTYVIVNVMLPVLLMSFLNVKAFWLPAESGERVSYAMTVLLAIAVFLTLVSDNLPKTSQSMSTICYFLLTNLVLSSTVMMIVITNLNVYHTPESSPKPKWLRWLTCFILRRYKKTEVPKHSTTTVSVIEDIDIPPSKSNHPDTCDNPGEKWATKGGNPEPEVFVAWKDVSAAVDRMSWIGAFIWLIVSVVAFFLMVITQQVPGV